MSLYDSFFSDINKDHVFNLIKDNIFKNNNIDINLDSEYRQIYDKNIKNIFDTNNVNSLEEINSILINETIKLFNDKINLNDNGIKDYNTNVRSDYDKLFAERQKQNELFKNMKTQEEIKKEKLENQRLEEQRLEEQRLEEQRLEEQRIEEQQLKRKTLEYEKVEENKLKLDSVSFQSNNVDSIEEWRPVQKFVSNKRTHIRSSRYNYTFNIKNNNIDIRDNSQIEKLIIPLEDNYIFNHSIICLSIKELELDISLELEKELNNNQRTYGVYIPIEAHRFSKPDTNSITVKITDITNTEYINQDIINVTNLEIADDTIILNVNSVKDIIIDDYFKVLNLSTNIMELRYLLLEPLKVIKIENNRLFFKTNYIMNSTIVDDIEMKLMNVSNQNIIFFK